MKSVRLLLPLFILIGLVGCVQHPSGIPAKAHLTPNLEVSLPPPPNLNIEQQQLLSAKAHNQIHQIIALLKIDQQKLQLVGLTPIGIKLFTIEYDANNLLVQQHISIPSAPPPQQALLDILLAYGTLSDWDNRFPPNWKIYDQGKQRFVEDAEGQLVFTIFYDSETNRTTPVSILNFAFGYEINIEILSE